MGRRSATATGASGAAAGDWEGCGAVGGVWPAERARSCASLFRFKPADDAPLVSAARCCEGSVSQEKCSGEVVGTYGMFSGRYGSEYGVSGQSRQYSANLRPWESAHVMKRPKASGLRMSTSLQQGNWSSLLCYTDWSAQKLGFASTDASRPGPHETSKPSTTPNPGTQEGRQLESYLNRNRTNMCRLGNAYQSKDCRAGMRGLLTSVLLGRCSCELTSRMKERCRLSTAILDGDRPELWRSQQ